MEAISQALEEAEYALPNGSWRLISFIEKLLGAGIHLHRYAQGSTKIPYPANTPWNSMASSLYPVVRR